MKPLKPFPHLEITYLAEMAGSIVTFIKAVSVILLVSLLSFSATAFAQGVGSENACKQVFDKPLVYFQTDNDRYLTGSKIIVNGKIFDRCGDPLTSQVLVELFKLDDPNKPYQNQLTDDNLVLNQSKLSGSGEFRQIIDIRRNEQTDASDFVIRASVTDNGVSASSFSPIQIRDFPNTGVGIAIFAEVFFIACLLTLIYTQLRHGWSIPSVEPFRFALLTLCSVIPILIFIGADVQLGQDAPFGVVIKHFEEPIKEITFQRLTEESGTVDVSQQENTVSKFEWMINVGGSPLDNYRTGIQIPVFVLVFGLIGGYLRFLRKTSQGWVREKIRESVAFFSKTEEALPSWAKKSVAALIANRYYVTTPGGEMFNRIATCHVCNMHKDYIQAADNKGSGEPVCPECFRKRSKSCNYCKLNVNMDIKEKELDLMEIEDKIEKKEKEILEYKDALGKKENKKTRKKLEDAENKLEELRKTRKETKIKLEPLYIKRTTEIRRGRCQNILQKEDVESLKSAEELGKTSVGDVGGSLQAFRKIFWWQEDEGMQEGEKCNRLNLDNKHFIRRWKNKSKLQKRFYPQVSRAIFNNSMEDLALIFLPPVLAFAVYFILLQAGITAQENMPTIAAVSLGVGLITKEALQKLEGLARGVVGGKNESDNETSEKKKAGPENT